MFLKLRGLMMWQSSPKCVDELAKALAVRAAKITESKSGHAHKNPCGHGSMREPPKGMLGLKLEWLQSVTHQASLHLVGG